MLVAATLLKLSVTTVADVSLSPETWPSGEFDRLKRMSLSRYERPKPLAVSEGKGLVAATTVPFAVHSGMDAMRKGGNAMDACLATALAGRYTSLTELLALVHLFFVRTCVFIEKLIIFRRGYLMSLLPLVTPSNDPPISRAFVFFNDAFYLKLLKLTKINLVLQSPVQLNVYVTLQKGPPCHPFSAKLRHLSNCPIIE